MFKEFFKDNTRFTLKEFAALSGYDVRTLTRWYKQPQKTLKYRNFLILLEDGIEEIIEMFEYGERYIRVNDTNVVFTYDRLEDLKELKKYVQAELIRYRITRGV